MALPVAKLGTTYPERVEVIDVDRARAYAAATNDDNPAYESGRCAPPLFGVVPTWGAIALAVTDVVPPEALIMIVHGEQDMHFHQPLVPGRSIATASQPHSVRVGRSGTRYTVRVRSRDADTGEDVLEQYVTMFIRGMTDGESAGPDKPDHTFPEEARHRKVAERSVHVDEDQTFRYRDASGDENPIHVDDEFARAVGLPGIVVHGLCTMAMTGSAVIEAVADGDPVRLTRLALRFARSVFPGSDLTTSVYDVGARDGGGGTPRRAYAFEAHSRGELVISNGLAEVEG
jgi:acyl dehydratase